MCPKGTLSRARSTVPKKCVCCTKATLRRKGKSLPVGDHCFALLVSPQALALAFLRSGPGSSPNSSPNPQPPTHLRPYPNSSPYPQPYRPYPVTLT